jgi:hypothetical protein
MPTLIAGRMVTRALLIGGIFSATFFVVPAVHAQQVHGSSAGDNGTGTSTSPGGNGGGGGAPLFRLPNFIGDRRCDDLYVYMHETEKPPWDTYRNYVRGLAGQTVNLQPWRRSPDASTAGNSAAANSMIMSAGSAAGQMMDGSGNQDGNQNNNLSGNGNQNSTGSSPAEGSNLPPPDTMTPPEATAVNYDLPPAGAVTNVSGMVVGPGSELIPGLMQ